MAFSDFCGLQNGKKPSFQGHNSLKTNTAALVPGISGGREADVGLVRFLMFSSCPGTV
jgi:hypothetical protein